MKRDNLLEEEFLGDWERRASNLHGSYIYIKR